MKMKQTTLNATNEAKLMELLCSLSPTPAPIGSLCRDLQISAPTLRKMIEELNGRGLSVTLSDAGLSVPAADWPHVRAAADRYWKQAHSTMA